MMRFRFRSMGVLATVLALPFVLGGGCAPFFLMLLCFFSGGVVPGTVEDDVLTQCEDWALGGTFTAQGEEENEALVVKGKNYFAKYESGPTLLQSGPFEARIEVAVDRESDLYAGYTRQYLRVEDQADPKHFLQVVAVADPTDGYSITAENESGLVGSAVLLAATDFVTLRIIRDAVNYTASAAPASGVFTTVGNAIAAPSGLLRLRFGTDNLTKNARVIFHTLSVSADSIGDEVLAPVFNSLTNAFAEIDLAAGSMGTDDFEGAAGHLDAAETGLADARALVLAAKHDGTIAKVNQPKLALGALKAGKKKAGQGGKLAQDLADNGEGAAGAILKRINAARREAMLATANLAGAKTKNAKKVAKHIVLRG